MGRNQSWCPPCCLARCIGSCCPCVKLGDIFASSCGRLLQLNETDNGKDNEVTYGLLTQTDTGAPLKEH
ncbi:hypothetical protein VCHA47P369_30277 [Vibrio chagasii]|nr:hypothetical protein VCHA27O13_10298 [Vibrio chagasii]CAH6834565.1 hypothetical protein VCHA34P131_10221 [Vibrio chagasii]CAH6837957.1 hypothetical protein VCHA34P112_10062 [Vibrio chagasii]CAH6838086.1 hypothetical protein VCHA32P90_10311 [Vibrio chagasii]CAH6838829.1 hypothetical protein VCHA28O22_10301 [Vibrio chagasii]